MRRRLEGSHAAASGRVTRKHDPSPGALVTAISPPCRSTIARVMRQPEADPAALARGIGRGRSGRRCGRGRRPGCRDRRRAPRAPPDPRRSACVTATCAPGPAYLMAFSARLKTTRKSIGRAAADACRRAARRPARRARARRAPRAPARRRRRPAARSTVSCGSVNAPASARARNSRSSTRLVSRSTSSRQLSKARRGGAVGRRRGERDLELAAQDRQRRAQLVGGVGAELARRGERSLQPRQHVVQHGGEPAELVVGRRPRRGAATGPPRRCAAAASTIVSTGASARPARNHPPAAARGERQRAAARPGSAGSASGPPRPPRATSPPARAGPGDRLP